MAVSLTVSDIERLAKAGVTMAIGDAGGQVMPVPDFVERPLTQYERKPETLEDCFWLRWWRSRLCRNISTHYNDAIPPFKVLATVHGDKVWVSIHPANFNYEPFQLQDAKAIFPSDALMASVALWENNHP